MAERAELDVSYISQIERGLRDPSLTSLVALARGLGVTLASLVGDDDDTTDDAPIVRTIAREIAELDEATQRDALEIVRRFRASVKRAAKTRGRD